MIRIFVGLYSKGSKMSWKGNSGSWKSVEPILFLFFKVECVHFYLKKSFISLAPDVLYA